MIRQRKEPGSDHPIAIVPFDGRVRVFWNGLVVADTTRALQLVESTYPPAWYIPRADVRAELLRDSATKTWCPYKGEASYHTLESSGHNTPDAVWVYETPSEAVRDIAGHLAFYPGRVERIEITAAA
jgi:uncharacterized protein (DUF427 family)